MPTVNPATLMWSGETSESSLMDNFRSVDFKPVDVYSITCSADATRLDILNASGLPAGGQLYPGTLNVYAKVASATRISPVLWQVRISYEGYVSNAPGGFTQSPILTPAIVDWSDVEVEAEIDQDFDGNEIVTAAGERVNGIRAIFCDQVATIKKNMLTYDSYFAAKYRRSVNSDWFLGWPPGTAKLMQLSAKDIKGEYYEVTGVVQFRVPYRTTPAKAWYARWKHEGFYHRDAVTPTDILRAIDKEGEYTTNPVPLAADGTKAFPDAPPIWKETKLYDSLPYEYLGFFT